MINPKRLLCSLFLPIVLGLACNKNTDEGGESTESERCLDNEAFFSEEIWWPILAEDCSSCHNSQGAAKNSNFVLQSSWQTGFMRENLKRFSDVSAFKVNDSSVVLLKPTAQLEHGGGKRFTVESDWYRRLWEMVERISSPVTCENQGEVDPLFGFELMSAKSTLRKASLSLASRLPTKEEIDVLAAGGDVALRQALGPMLEAENFYSRLREIYNEVLLTDRYYDNQDAISLLSTTDYPKRRWYDAEPDEDERNQLRSQTNKAIARGPLELIVHVVRENRPFTEILTANYAMVNPYSARSYGVVMGAFPDGGNRDDYAASQFFEAQLGDIPHAGLLTSHMVLNRFPTSDTNVNRHRSRMVYRLFLATDVMSLAERPVDPTSIEDFNPTLYSPSCAVCHAVIDPVAGAFQNWDEQGRFNPPENGWFEELRPPGLNGEKIPHEQRTESLKWLGAKIAADRRFALATVHHVYKSLVGRDVVRPPTYVRNDKDRAQLRVFNAQSVHVDALVERFISSGFSLKELIKDVVLSPYFRVNSLKGEVDAVLLQHLGATRFLTPEMLHRKIEAVTGYRWMRYSRDLLLSENYYKIFYGGIDSDQITKRITEPNGIMANITWRMANAVSCRAVVTDFSLLPEERRLFPYVRRTYLPKDQNGFEIAEAVSLINKNIQHLHYQLLGEELPLEHPDIQKTYELFMETWQEGKTAVEESEESQNTPGACRKTIHPVTGEDLPNDRRVVGDSNYLVRSWMAVVTYLLSDTLFLHE